MSKFDSISVGDSAELEHLVSQADLDRFVELTGDDNRLHTDATYAAATSFRKPVAHGMLGAAFISTVIGTQLPGDGALWFAQSLEFLLPVRVGDRITVRAEVIGKDERTQSISLQTEIHNQHRQKVTSGVARVKVVEPEPPAVDVPALVPRQRVALVVGGSGGIGAAVCATLARDGFDVAVHYSSNADAAAVVTGTVHKYGRAALSVRANVASEAEVRAMVNTVVRKLGGLHVVVNCATAKIANVAFDKLVWADFEAHLDMSIKGSFFLARHAATHLAGAGKFICIGSQATQSPSVDWLPYITAKAALEGFVHALAVELAPRGVRVNMVSPGMTETDQIAEIPERVRLLIAAKTPLRRLASPQDVAEAVAFLASARSDFLTGETIRVNGGQVMT